MARSSSSKSNNSNSNELENKIVIINEKVTTTFENNFNGLTEDQIDSIITKLSVSKGVPRESIKNAIFMLLLRGAGSSGAPENLKVQINYSVIDNENKKLEGSFTLTKGELLNIYNNQTKNKYLRRLAETLANEISSFAEQNNLNGDLANQLNTYRLSEGLDPLTAKQKAWASSFNQNNPSLETNQELLEVAKLLARDFMIKFKSNKTPNKKEKKSSPKRQGQTKPKPTQSKQVKKRN